MYGTAMMGLLGGESAGYYARAVTFGNDYLNRGTTLTGAFNTKVLSMSFWIRPADLSQSCFVMGINTGSGQADNRFPRLLTNGTFQIQLESSGGVACLSATTATALSINTWYHILISVDLANSSNRAIYINGVLDSTTWSTYINAEADLTVNDWFIATDAAGGNRLSASLSDLWFNIGGAWLDITNSTNREKFILAGKPVNLGGNGSLPTGSSPIVFLSGNSSTFATNKGTGEGFTTTGTIINSPTSPSD
jgi:hypothetical protein